MAGLKTIVVMPAFNAELTLAKTVADIPMTYVDEIILVDDASVDRTVEKAWRIKSKVELEQQNGRRILFTVESLPHNIGYGGNQKQCYDRALEHCADIVVMLHPDYQYDPSQIPLMVDKIQNGTCDVVLGSRIRTRREALRGGMPLYKYFANRILSFIQNVAASTALSEWHSGMRAYKKEVLQSISYHTFSNDFLFDTQALFAIIEQGFRIGEIPVPVRYSDDSSSINFRRSVRYGIGTLLETIRFAHRRYCTSRRQP